MSTTTAGSAGPEVGGHEPLGTSAPGESAAPAPSSLAGAAGPLAAIPSWEYEPWTWAQDADAAERSRMAAARAALRDAGHQVAESATVARLAVVTAEHLTLGERSYLAAFTHVSGTVTLGADCSVNVGTDVRGTVLLGDGVRIGAHTSLLGFDHVFTDPNQPVFRQPLRSRGVEIGDDVWIGSHVVVRDGVRIGAHAVVGAGSVVVSDVPEWAIVVGNPARVVRSRQPGAEPSSTPQPPAPAEGTPARAGAAVDRRARLARVGSRLRGAAPDLLARAWDGEHFHDPPGSPATVRALTDAVELADLTGSMLPGGPDHAATLRSWQDPLTGLVAELDDGQARSARQTATSVLPDHERAYHVLAAGYALHLLGSSFDHPVAAITGLDAETLTRALDAAVATEDPWGAGALVDTVGTALTWERLAGRPDHGLVAAVQGWVLSRRDPGTGLWGTTGGGLRLPVNGAYRLTRGTLAAWGVQPPGQEAYVDAVLRRTAEGDVLASACDALDVVHPLWWARHAVPGHRQAEVAQVAASVVDVVAARFADGWPFAPGEPLSLKGTEMWAAVVWYAADLLGVSDALGYRPRGVHRPEPWISLPAAGEQHRGEDEDGSER